MKVIANQEFGKKLLVGKEYEVLAEKTSAYRVKCIGGTMFIPKACFDKEVEEVIEIKDTLDIEVPFEEEKPKRKSKKNFIKDTSEKIDEIIEKLDNLEDESAE